MGVTPRGATMTQGNLGTHIASIHIRSASAGQPAPPATRRRSTGTEVGRAESRTGLRFGSRNPTQTPISRFGSQTESDARLPNPNRAACRCCSIPWGESPGCWRGRQADSESHTTVTHHHPAPPLQGPSNLKADFHPHVAALYASSSGSEPFRFIAPARHSTCAVDDSRAHHEWPATSEAFWTRHPPSPGLEQS
ncbi:hypothetical protein BKA93DRAFT_761893 [Sparassis latifolia]